MKDNIETKFLILCKQNYFDKITPANKKNSGTPNFIELVQIAKKYFNDNKYQEFSDFFQEGQYFINLWAAHLLIDYGKPDHDIHSQAISIIKDYSNNPLAPEVSHEEKEWLVNYLGSPNDI